MMGLLLSLLLRIGEMCVCWLSRGNEEGRLEWQKETKNERASEGSGRDFLKPDL